MSDRKAKKPRTEKTTSFPKSKIKVLLLENVHPHGVELFRAEGNSIECLKGALSEEELRKKIKGVHVLGVRSKTTVSASVLENADRLLAIGCFCIGTDKVDLPAARRKGVPVFNAPFANTRSVAELVICEMIALARKLGDVSRELHEGLWNKSAAGCFEVRGKTLGIVGYGHVGSQVSVLAEALGMTVKFFDVIPKLALGNSTAVPDLETLLQESDIVTLHVPGTPRTKDLIGRQEIEHMKKGAFLINASRGSVVDLDAMAAALRSGHLGGGAVDVYPSEPAANGPGFKSVLQACPNTILTPHVGGSTAEAQAAIGVEVAAKLIKFVNQGGTVGAVNFPEIDNAVDDKTHRVLNIHQNKPGVLSKINVALSGANVSSQSLKTYEDVGFFMADVDMEVSADARKALEALPENIRTRLLY